MYRQAEPPGDVPWEEPRRLSPLVSVITARNPSPLTLAGTNTYLIEAREGRAVLDPGPAHPEHLQKVARETGGRALAVLLTHSHPDHAEGARELARVLGAPVLGPARAAPDRPLADGEKPLSGLPLEVVATPGHSPDHLCYLLEPEGALFTGDHVLGWGTTLVEWPEGDMDAYLASLKRLLQLSPRRLYPGHGPPVEEPEPWIRWYLRHREEREAQILWALRAGLGSLAELVKHVYAEIDPILHPAAELTLLAHLERLRRRGLALREGAAWKPVLER